MEKLTVAICVLTVIYVTMMMIVLIRAKEHLIMGEFED